MENQQNSTKTWINLKCVIDKPQVFYCQNQSSLEEDCTSACSACSSFSEYAAIACPAVKCIPSGKT